MRLLTLCYEWPPVGGGGGRAARDIAESLVRRGHAVRVQTIRFGDSPRFAQEQGVEVYRTFGFRSKADRCSPAEMAGYLLTSALPTLRHLHEFKPDLIHAHFAVPTGALALPMAILGRIPYVITAHLGDVPGAIPEQTDHLFERIQPFIRPIWKRAAAVAGVSQFVADLAQRAYGRPVQVIPNGISLTDRPLAPGRSQNRPRFIFVGRLNSQKNLRFLPTILGEMKQYPWSLDIVGDGEERTTLAKDFQQAGLAERVTFHGWLGRPQVEAALRTSDIFLMPSLVEGLSVAALEALKFGLIIVGSEIPAFRDCIDPGKSGFLLPLTEPDHWVSTLKGLLADPDRRLQMRRCAWALGAKFDLEVVAEQYEKLFGRVLEERPQRRSGAPKIHV